MTNTLLQSAALPSHLAMLEYALESRRNNVGGRIHSRAAVAATGGMGGSMIGRAAWLTRHPAVFRAMAGIDMAEYRRIVGELAGPYATAERQRLARPARRAVGGGRRFALSMADRVLLTIVWLRQHPTFPVLCDLFELDDRPASRAIARILPLPEAAGRDSMRLPDPGPYRRRGLPQVLESAPGLLVLVDAFEQRVQRLTDRQERRQWYSGKKRCHTSKVQVAVEERAGRIVDVGDSVPSPTADLAVFAGSGLGERLPPGTALHPAGHRPRKKPRGRPRPDEDRAHNRALARRRIAVEHRIGRLRRFAALTAPHRQHRTAHTRLVNRQLAP